MRRWTCRRPHYNRVLSEGVAAQTTGASNRTEADMTDRTLVSLGALTLLVAGLSAVPLVGQTRPEGPKADAKSAVTKPWSPPLAPDGHADLQGFWIVKTATPLERPKELEGKQRLTDEEVAELKKRAARIFKGGNSDFGAGDVVF